MYGKLTLAHTGATAAAMVGLKVMGVTVPYWAMGSAALVAAGAVMVRLTHKHRTAKTEQ